MKSFGETDDLSLPLEARQRIHQRVEEFIEAWKQFLNNDDKPNMPRIETFLAGLNEQYQGYLIRELIEEDVHYRTKCGEPPKAADYASRFPNYQELISRLCAELDVRQESRPDVSEEEMPKQIGRFPVLEVLGKGAYGIVYRGRHERLDRDVAIKVPRKGRNVRLFLREGQILAKLRHPNIVAVYDVDQTEDGRCFVVSEFIDGCNLSTYMDKQQLSTRQSVRLVSTVAEALGYAHKQRIYHRDIKPANILIDTSGSPYVADFGLALTKDEYGIEAARVGTPYYMSPEQIRWESHLVDGRTDIFSLGVVLYQLLTRELPFEGSTLEEVVERIQKLDARPLREIRSDLPIELERICMKAMSKKPVDRYSIASDMASDLKNLFPREKLAPVVDDGADMTDGFAPAEWMEHAMRRPEQIGPVAAKVDVGALGPNPYKGLETFTEEDAAFFFGRDKQIERLWNAFRDLHTEPAIAERRTRILSILGPSGSGKSSLARAGLLATLRRKPLPDRENTRFAVITPTERPCESLANELAKIATGDSSPVRKAREFETCLREKNTDDEYDGLRRVVDLLPEIEHSPLVLLIDQFEELFTQRRHQATKRLSQHEEERAFIQNLLHASSDSSKRFSIILTLRSDFLGETQDHQQFNQLIAEYGLIVPAMTDEELRSAITEPASMSGYAFNIAVVDKLMDESRGREGALPLLQFALEQIWQGLREGVPPAETLHNIKGVGGAIATKAQAIFDELSETDREIARHVFLGLVQLGEGVQDTRRRAEIDELVAFRDDRSSVQRVLNHFAQKKARLITVSKEKEGSVDDARALTGKETAEVTHEALIEHWRQLREWIDENRESLRLARRLELDAKDWIRGKQRRRKPESQAEDRRIAVELWRGGQLEALSTYVNAGGQLSFAGMAFYRACNRRHRIELGIRYVTAATILVLGLISGYKWLEADNEAQRAIQSEQHALYEASKNATLAGVLRLHGNLGNAGGDPFGLLHLVEACKAADQSTRKAKYSLWAGWYQTVANRLLHVVGHREPKAHVVDVSIDPDGKFFATASDDGSARVWTLSTGALTSDLYGSDHQDEVTIVQFSPDGSLLVTACSDGRLRIWDARTEFKDSWELYREHSDPAHRDAIISLAFVPGDVGPSDTLLVTGSQDGSARVWNVASRQLVTELQSGVGSVHGLACSLDGRLLASLSTPDIKEGKQNDSVLTLWRYSTDREEWVRKDTMPFAWNRPTLAGTVSTRHGIAFHPDRSFVVVALDQQASVISFDDDDNLKKVVELGHGNLVWSVKFSPDGQWLATAGADDRYQLNRFGELLKRRRSGSAAPNVYSFYGKEGRSDRVAFHDGDVRAIAFGPDSRMLATASFDSRVRLWRIERERDNSSWRVIEHTAPLQHFGRVWAVEFSPNGRTLVTGSSDGTAKVWTVSAELGTRLPHDDAVNTVAISTDDHLIATASDDHSVRLWSLPHGVLRNTLRHDSEVTNVVFDSDSRRVASGCVDGTIHIWNVDGTQVIELPRLSERERVGSLDFSPDGAYLSAAYCNPMSRSFAHLYSGRVAIWDLRGIGNKKKARKEPIQDWARPVGHYRQLGAMAFSSNSRQFAFGNHKEVKVWDLKNGHFVLPSFSHDQNVTNVHFIPNSTALVTAGWDAARIWDFNTQAKLAPPLQHGKGIISADLSPRGIYATGGDDAKLRIWRTDGWVPVTRPIQHRAAVSEVMTSAHGETVCTKSGNWITFWQSEMGLALAQFYVPGIGGLARDIAMTSDGRIVAVPLTSDSALILRNPSAPQVLELVELETKVALAAEFAIDGQVTSIPPERWRQLRKELEVKRATQSVILTSNDADWYAHRAAGLLHGRDYRAAIWHLTRLLQIDHSDVWAFRARAGAYRQIEQMDLAIADYDQYLKLRPTDVDALFQLAECQLVIEQYAGAWRSLSDAVKYEQTQDAGRLNEYRHRLLMLGSELRGADNLSTAFDSYSAAETILTKLVARDESPVLSESSPFFDLLRVYSLRAKIGEAIGQDSDGSVSRAILARGFNCLREAIEAGRFQRLDLVERDNDLQFLRENSPEYAEFMQREDVRATLREQQLVANLYDKHMVTTLVTKALREDSTLDAQRKKKLLKMAASEHYSRTPEQLINEAWRLVMRKALNKSDYYRSEYLSAMKVSGALKRVPEFSRDPRLTIIQLAAYYRLGDYEKVGVNRILGFGNNLENYELFYTTLRIMSDIRSETRPTARDVSRIFSISNNSAADLKENLDIRLDVAQDLINLVKEAKQLIADEN